MFMLAVFSLSAFFMIGSPVAASDPPNEIKIGMTLAITGHFSTEWGQPGLNYMRALESIINDRGGINVKEYGKKIPVKFIIYDDGSSPDKSVELYEKLATVDKVHFFIGPAASPILIKASTVAEKYGIPMMGVEGNSPYIYARGFKWLVGVDSPASNWAASYYEMMNYLIKEKKIPKVSTVAIIKQDNPHTLDLGGGAERHAKAAGFKVVMVEKVPMRGMSDFSPIISKLKAKNPDIVYMATFNNVGAIFAKQAAESGYKPFDLHIPHCTLSLPWYNMVGAKIANGITGMSTTAPFKKGDLEAWEDSLKRCGFSTYEFGCAATRFLAVEALTKGIETAGTLDRAKVMEALRNLEYETLYGKLSFSKGMKMGPLTVNGMGNKPPYMAQWQNGEIKILWPLDVANGEFVKR